MNKTDWRRRKKMAHAIGKVQCLHHTACPSTETREQPQPSEELGTSSRSPRTRAAPAAAAGGRCSAGPRRARAGGPGPGWQLSSADRERPRDRAATSESPGLRPCSPDSPGSTEIERTHVPISHSLEGSCGACADSLNAEISFECYLHIPGRQSTTILKTGARAGTYKVRQSPMTFPRTQALFPACFLTHVPGPLAATNAQPGEFQRGS